MLEYKCKIILTNGKTVKAIMNQVNIKNLKECAGIKKIIKGEAIKK